MDLNEFSEQYFDPKIWLNRNVKSNEEHHVQKHIGILQAYFHQLNLDIEQTTCSIMQSLPRVLHDIDVISEEAKNLKTNMNSVKGDIANVENDTINELEKIDKIRTLLVDGKQALYEADNWTVLSTDIEAIFETSDIDLIASKLISMQQSLNVLSQSADFETKKMQLEGLKNRLEALTSPLMVEAFSKLSVDASKKFVKIFEDIDRMPQLLKYFTKCQNVRLVQMWQSILDEAEDNIVVAFGTYYELLLTSWQDQVRWCLDVIPKCQPVDILFELYEGLLLSLSPEFQSVIENHLKEHSEPITVLLQLKVTAKSFLDGLKPKLGSRFCISKAVFAPYVPHISKFASYHQTTLFQNLINIKDNIDPQIMGRENRKILDTVKDGVKICLNLSEGCVLPDYFKTVNNFIIKYLDIYRNILMNLNDDVNLFQTCITILLNLGDFLMEIKQFDQDCVQTIITIDNDLKKSENYLKLLVTTEKHEEFENLVSKLTESSEPSVLKVYTTLESICKDVYNTSFRVIFKPISTLLETIPTFPIWKARNNLASDLPDYSLAPQEYITQIGQYLMNLPQLLEPFMSLDNPSLNLALSLVAMDFCHLADSLHGDSSSFAEIILARIADSTCQQFAEQILNIDDLSTFGCKQLITDINYFGNVLEDLGLCVCEKLKNICVLLKLDPNNFASGCTGISPQIVAGVRQMRNIV